MSVNISEFAADLSAFKASTEKQFVEAQRKVTLQILRGVILANPVDTGRMRAAWTASVGAPASGEGGGADLAGLTFGQSSWVVNNVEYAGHVNETHRDKSHFVETVVSNVQSALEVSL